MVQHSDSSNWRDSDLPFAKRLDMACDEFEARWGQGDALSLVDILAEFEESNQPQVLRELEQNNSSAI